MKFNHKIALVTAGNRGLGKNTALRLASYGADSIITDHSHKEEADSVVSEIEAKDQRAVALQLDVGNIKSFDGFMQQVSNALKDKWGRDKFDFLINNAGIGGHATIDQMTEEVFDRLFTIHFKGVYFLTQKAIPFLNDNGRVVNISSGLARFTFPGYSAYASMKGAIEKDFTKPAFDADPQRKEMIASLTALGRVGVPEDIGGVVAFLCSEDARWVNGQRLEASGGVFS